MVNLCNSCSSEFNKVNVSLLSRESESAPDKWKHTKKTGGPRAQSSVGPRCLTRIKQRTGIRADSVTLRFICVIENKTNLL